MLTAAGQSMVQDWHVVQLKINSFMKGESNATFLSNCPEIIALNALAFDLGVAVSF